MIRSTITLRFMIPRIFNAPHFLTNNEKVKEQEVNNLDNLEEMKFAQLESYMSGDDNGGIANLSLYL